MEETKQETLHSSDQDSNMLTASNTTHLNTQHADNATVGSSNPASSVTSVIKSDSSTAGISEDGSYLLSSTRVRIRSSELRKPATIKPAVFQYQKQSNSQSKHYADFEPLGIVGRERETAQLKACLGRILAKDEDRQQSENKKEIVLIGGLSGTGKTRLACALENDVSRHPKGMFVHGKFDMNTSNEPYSGVSRTFNELCRKIKNSKAELVCLVQSGISQHLGNNTDMLVHLVPELKDLINDTFHESSAIDIGTDEIDNKLERLRFAFRVLMRAISTTFSPLVILFDDLQWSDISSLQILDFLISDTQNENPFMIIGCYRSEEADENSLLYNKIVSLREKADKYNFQMTEMMIQSFSTQDIQEVIRTVLPCSNDKDKVGLAALCLKRTFGNPFFLMEFLKMLHHEGLLEHHAPKKTWTWDLAEIEAATMSTANVAVMLQGHLTKLSHQQQALLQCAAYLGSSFSETTIDLIWTTYGRRLVETRIEKTHFLLEAIVKEDILEKCYDNQYRWVHDRLQEAALSLAGERRETFQLDIGRTLYYGLDKKEVEDELFAIVDLINNGNVLQLAEFASANLKAAEKARDLSAFESAKGYAIHGIDLLADNKWSENRPLTLSLYIIAAEMELLLGNVAAADQYSSEVLCRTDLSPMDVLPLKMAKASTIGSVDLKFGEAMDQYFVMLKELGCRLTWTRGLVPVQALTKLMRTVKRVKAKPKSFYETMVPIDDVKQKAIASVVSRMVYFSYIAGDLSMNLLCTCFLVNSTLEFGVNEYSAKCFAALANVVTLALHDFETATTFNMIALSMLEKFRGMHSSETTFLAYAPGLVWVKRIEDCSEPMRDAVEEGMKMGDTEFAIWNLFSHVITLPYSIGKPISSIIDECPRILLQCEDVSQAAHSMAVKVMWQMLYNLQQSSCNHNPADLEGEIFSSAQDNEINPLHLSFVHLAQGELSFFNADYEATAMWALQVGERYTKLLPNYFPSMIETFHRAVALYAATIRTKKRKYRVEAKRLAKKIEKWAAAGNPNAQYYNFFLAAEQLGLDKKFDAAEEKYEAAIDMATREGHLHHQGLLNERYSDFFLRRSMKKESVFFLKEAIRHYTEWGAAWKVESLESRL
ncbi:unnamed protein product [Cylindrotheca closterium]|uniref:Orc1-like AAA ATPase domain-containing protein n=1 Tax=Cylindrotheca closterium TaxID=2856 RepID=A0AAD2G2R8_9STRA|nr:unnamed protein product [Cylindrotheca closterium]